jgi:hypothetical protein
MKMIKQRPTPDGTIAVDCGVCVIAMLTDLPFNVELHPDVIVLCDRSGLPL